MSGVYGEKGGSCSVFDVMEADGSNYPPGTVNIYTNIHMQMHEHIHMRMIYACICSMACVCFSVAFESCSNIS